MGGNWNPLRKFTQIWAKHADFTQTVAPTENRLFSLTLKQNDLKCNIILELAVYVSNYSFQIYNPKLKSQKGEIDTLIIEEDFILF